MSRICFDVDLAAYRLASDIASLSEEQKVISQTMAKDRFLKKALTDGEEERKDDIIDYLKDIRGEFGYNNVFLVSARTGRYYFQGGIDKVVSKENEADAWYFNFLKLNILRNTLAKRGTHLVNDTCIAVQPMKVLNWNITAVKPIGSRMDAFMSSMRKNIGIIIVILLGFSAAAVGLLSIGVTDFIPEMTFDEMIKRAGVPLYEAKRNKKGTVVVRRG